MKVPNCRARWQYGRHYVNRLIAASQVFAHVVTNCHQKFDHESQVRPLIHLLPEQAQQVWDYAAEKCPNRRITAKHVASAARQLNLSRPSNPVQKQTGATATEKRRLVTEAMTELLTLLHQKADHPTLVEKAESLHRHIRAAFARCSC